MADIALGSVGKIIDLALKIKEAVETVKQNEKECRNIQTCVARVSALLKELDEKTETMKNEAMRDTLEDLVVSLNRALELVTECQRKHILLRFLGARNKAKELARVQDDIVRKLQMGSFAAQVHTTVMLTNIQSTAIPASPHLPTEDVIIPGFKRFSLSDLKAATMEFSDTNVIGSGAFSKVYKGTLHDGQVIAIKNISDSFFTRYEENQLYDSINIFIELEHKNIVRPVGYCHEVIMVMVRHDGRYKKAKAPRFCYVEEYMENGTMHGIISGYQLVDWSSLFKIIQGIAKGLHYLHVQRVVHMDIKPTNILFDSNMNPRISDFGIAKKLDHVDDEVITDHYIAGSPGYLAPEFIVEGILSTKCDVYAFGQIIVQAISTMCKPREDIFIHDQLAEWVRMELEAGRTKDMFDPTLVHESQINDVRRCMDVGMLCCHFDRKQRPTMPDVIEMLNGEKELTQSKKP